MTARVNLLPESYRRARRHGHRFRLAVTAGAVLLVVEFCVGLILHARAGETRRLLGEAEVCREAANAVRQELAGPEQELALVNQQIELARRLRTTHRWSRLLALLSTAASDQVVLTEVSTDPPKWSRSLEPVSRSAGREGTGRSAMSRPMLEGVNVTGYAADHPDLLRFVTAVQQSGAFALVNVTQARRDQFLSKEAIRFDVRCRW